MPTGTNLISFPGRSERPEQKPERKRRKKRADGRYQVPLDLGRDKKTGKRRRKVFYGKTYAEALKKAEEYKRLVVDGIDLDNIDITLRDWIERCRPLYNEGRAPATILKHDKELNALIAAFGDRTVRSIKPIELQAYLNTRAGLTSSSIGKTRQAMAYIFKQAVVNGIILRNPEESLSIPSAKDDVGHRDLTEREIEVVLANAKRLPFGLAAVTMLFTGLRPQEALALDIPTDIDLDAEVVHVTKALKFGNNRGFIGGTKTKAGVRDVPIVEPLLSILRDVLAENPGRRALFVPVKGGEITKTVKKHAWKAYAQRAGIRVRPYDLRHTFATMVEDSQVVSDKTLQYWMGHKAPKKETITKRVYVHLSAQRLAEDTRRWKEYMRAKYPHYSGDGSQMVVKPDKSDIELPE